jgi:F-type H+-transporting ATPase subunit a
MEHEIVLKPEVIGYLGFLPVTNTLLVSWLVIILLTVLGLVIKSNIKLIPGGLQNLMEMVIEYGYNTVEELAHSRAKVIFPFVMTFFLFIITANWLGLLPGFATIGFYEQENGHQVFVPLLRSINSDLNMTLSLALVSAVVTHIFAIKYLGLGDYLKRWFSLQMFPVFLFVGFLEVISEITKVVSLSFRLFGNIFAGEVVLSTVSTLSKYTAFLVPLPFYFLEIIVGFVQAAVFMMLTLVFIVLLTEKHEEAH